MSSEYKYKSHNGKLVREHQVIVEKVLGYALPKGTVIHHVDECRSNNSHTNLVVCPSQAYHTLLHARTRAYDATGDANKRKCHYCGEYDSPDQLMILHHLISHRKCFNVKQMEYYYNKGGVNRKPFRVLKEGINQVRWFSTQQQAESFIESIRTIPHELYKIVGPAKPQEVKGK